MGSPRSSSSPTPTASPTSKGGGPRPHLGAGTSAPRPLCPCLARAPLPLSVMPAFLGPIRETRAVGGTGRAGQGKESSPRHEQTWHSDKAALGAMSRFWPDPGLACPLFSWASWPHGGVLGACGNAVCGSYGETFPDIRLGHPLTLSITMRTEGAQLRQLAACVLLSGEAQMGSWDGSFSH